MKSGSRSRDRALAIALVDESPLRAVDPRTKLALCLCLSLTVMLPTEKLAVAMIAYALLLTWARLLLVAGRQLWRMKWVLLVLFVGDWVLVSLDLAMAVTLRVSLLAGAFALFFATTTPGELRLALAWLRVPYRYAFSLSLAFQSLDLLDQEWRAIREAQRVRGIWRQMRGWRALVAQTRDLVALAVPAVVMTTRRAWAITEAAYARGFDSPQRRPYRALRMCGKDWAILIGATVAGVFLVWWR